MGNIPNTNTPNLVLQSVGNGSNDSRWGTSGGGSTLPTGTGTGQMIWWNGTGWVVTSTPATGKYFYWNGSAWVSANCWRRYFYCWIPSQRNWSFNIGADVVLDKPWWNWSVGYNLRSYRHRFYVVLEWSSVGNLLQQLVSLPATYLFGTTVRLNGFQEI